MEFTTTPSGIAPPNAAHNNDLTFEVHPRRVDVHYVMDGELDTLRATTASASLSFLGICVGAVFSCWGVLATQHDLSPQSHAIFITVLVGSVLLAAFFGFVAGRGYRGQSRLARDIRSRGSKPATVDGPVEMNLS
jgi:hypothetical protein